MLGYLSVMKNYLFVLLIGLGFAADVTAQTTLEKLFLALPEDALFLRQEHRQRLVRDKKLEDPQVGYYGFGVFDPQNGYLSITGAFEGGWEMCYWVTKAGGTLVAVSSYACGPVCYQEQYRFFEQRGTTLTEVEPPHEPITFEDLFDTAQLSPELAKELRDHEPNHLFSLPQRGTAIGVGIQTEVMDFDLPDGVLRKLRLAWADGRFVKRWGD